MINKREARLLSTKSILDLLTKELPPEDTALLRIERDRRDAKRVKGGQKISYTKPKRKR